MRIQSARPDTHSVSLTGSLSKSDIVRCTSGAEMLKGVFDSAVSIGRDCWSELLGSGGEEDIVYARTIGSSGKRSSGLL